MFDPGSLNGRPRGLMDKASDFGSEDWGFESLRGHIFFLFSSQYHLDHNGGDRADQYKTLNTKHE